MEQSKPIVFIKIETTGLDPVSDRIIFIDLHKKILDGSYQTLKYYFNPLIEVSEESFKIHNLSNSYLEQFKPFKDHCEEIYSFIKDCDFCGFNLKHFTIQFLLNEFYRSGKTFFYFKSKFIDIRTIFNKMFNVGSFDFIYSFLFNENAEPTSKIFETVLDEELKRLDVHTSDDLENYIGEDKFLDLSNRILKIDKKFVFNFGKYLNCDIFATFDKDIQYYEWILSSDTFSIDFKIALKALYIIYKKKK